MIVSTTTPTNPVLTTDEIDMLKWAVNYFNDNYYPHDEATPDEMKEYELQISTLYSALTKVRSN